MQDMASPTYEPKTFPCLETLIYNIYFNIKYLGKLHKSGIKSITYPRRIDRP